MRGNRSAPRPGCLRSGDWFVGRLRSVQGKRGTGGKGEGEERVGSGQWAVGRKEIESERAGGGVVTVVGRVQGREVVVVANDATVKAGSWWPETIKKILRAQEIAMRSHVPIIYLVDSAGVNLPYQGGVFPGQYGASRIFYYNSIMRRYLKIPQIPAVMGPCHCRRRLFARAFGRDRNGRGNVFHGTRWREPREGRHRPDDRQRNSRRRPRS